MPGRQPKKTSAVSRARTCAHEKPRVHFPDTISFGPPAGTLVQVTEAAAELDGVSPIEWLRGLLRRGLEASRKKRAPRG